MINFYNGQYALYRGVDLHKKTMYVYMINHDGYSVCHKNLRTRPDDFLRAIAPYREGLIVAVECMFAWYWLADLCRREGIAFILGHALCMKVVHGTKTRQDREDGYKIARLLPGGNFPLAYVHPPEWRPTRDLLRRRGYLVRRRAELLTHIQNTVTQHNFPALKKKKIAYKANRAGVAEHIADPLVRKSKYGKGKALSILSARLGRSVYHMLRKREAFDMIRFLGQN